MADTDQHVHGNALAQDETAGLIAASQAEATRVYNRQGEKLGHIHDTMIDKQTGETAYAVMSFVAASTPDWDDPAHDRGIDEHCGQAPAIHRVHAAHRLTDEQRRGAHSPALLRPR